MDFFFFFFFLLSFFIVQNFSWQKGWYKSEVEIALKTSLQEKETPDKTRIVLTSYDSSKNWEMKTE
jgi:hypothetical protein